MEQFAPRDNDVVLDTSVLMDCLFEDRAGHENAVRMACELAPQYVTAFVPAHSFFELVSAVSCHRRVDQKPLALGALGKALPFEWVIVTIDLAFVQEYLIAPAAAGVLIDLKGGDMIFVALAFRHNLTLM